MQKKNLIAKLLVVAILTLCTAEVVSAKVTDLVRWSSNTYVTSEHADGFFADTYTGIVSVRGKDRHYNGRETVYPLFSRITYDVQGDITVEQIDSQGSEDIKVRTKTVTVKDKWNLSNEKTTAKGRIDGKHYSNDAPYSLELNMK